MKDPDSQRLNETQRASDVIAETLIEEIRAAKISIGDPLPTERDLCERFSASRPTVREALSQMQIRGYLTTAAGHRPRAGKPSLETILRAAGGNLREILGDVESLIHLEQMRQFIEIGAVRAAAAKATNMQLAKLYAALEANFEAIGTDRFAETDIAFHRVLVSVVDNPIILILHDMFVSGLFSTRPAQINAAARHRTSYEEHRQIYQAVLERDISDASEIMERHLEDSYRIRLTPPRQPPEGEKPPQN